MKNTIPKNAKKVFEGVIFDVYQWPQQMYDGSVEAFEMLKRPDSAIVLPIVDGKILIESQTQPNHDEAFLTLPGGRVDPGEESLQAAKRELLEETGLSSDEWELWLEYNPVSKIDWTVYVYIARGCIVAKEPELESGEKITTRLVEFDEFLELVNDPKFRGRDQIIPNIINAQYNQNEKEKLCRKVMGQ